MAKIKVHDNGSIVFKCPGCKSFHHLNHPGNGPHWTFNGDIDKPTLTPSILSRSGHYVPGYNGDCWCKYNAEHPEDPVSEQFLCGICHSFVTDGKIQFLSDCTHNLAGQTVEIPEWED